MNLPQAIEQATALTFPAFLTDDNQRNAERLKNEEAIRLLTDAWMQAPQGLEPFDFSLVRGLADRNRELCDLIEDTSFQNQRGLSLAQRLTDADIVRGAAALQHRDVADVRKSAGPQLKDMGIAYVEAPVSGMISGCDIETFCRLAPKGKPSRSYACYCGLPEIYKERGVPLSEIHHITWPDLAGKATFRDNQTLQKALLAAFEAFPYLAHNAAFEDSWFMLNLDGYAEARKAEKITIIDTRDICRRIDPEVKVLPHDARPAALESWAKRRGTLAPDEKERHLGLDDVDLMIRTCEAEFKERNMFA